MPVAAISAVGFAFTNYDQVWAAMDGELGAYVRTAIDAAPDAVFVRRERDEIALRRKYFDAGVADVPARVAGKLVAHAQRPAFVQADNRAVGDSTGAAQPQARVLEPIAVDRPVHDRPVDRLQHHFGTRPAETAAICCERSV